MLVSCSVNCGSWTATGLFLQRSIFSGSLLSDGGPQGSVEWPRQRPASESHTHLWNALPLAQICETSLSALTELRDSDMLMGDSELRVDTETDMYFLGAMFVKEIAPQ